MNITTIYVIFTLLYVTLIWKSGKTYPILYLLLFTFFLQYIFSTYLIYNQYKELRAEMPVSQTQFFDYAIPALCFLFLGVILFNKDIDLRALLRKMDTATASRLGYSLLVISYGFDLVRLLGIAQFGSILSFTTYLKYLAAYCFLFSNSKRLHFISFLVYLDLIISVLKSGIFIDFITWGAFLIFFIALRFRLSLTMRSFLFLSTIPVVITIQSVKDEYRHAIWPEQKEGGITLFTELAQKRANSDEPFMQSSGVVRTMARLSQGWHLGLTLRRVPRIEPYAGGSEMLSDITSSLLPRFLFPEKKIVHTKEKFYKYTGHKLHGNTAMTIGILGDFYVNFGRMGSFFMLFIFGALIAVLTRKFLLKYVMNDPINIVWLPYFLSYLIRADNDFYIFFNAVVKGFLIFLVVNYFRYQYLEPKKNSRMISPPVTP